jgi:hypothetical protein
LLLIDEIFFFYLSKAFKIFQISNADLFSLQKGMAQAGMVFLSYYY